MVSLWASRPISPLWYSLPAPGLLGTMASATLNINAVTGRRQTGLVYFPAGINISSIAYRILAIPVPAVGQLAQIGIFSADGTSRIALVTGPAAIGVQVVQVSLGLDVGIYYVMFGVNLGTIRYRVFGYSSESLIDTNLPPGKPCFSGSMLGPADISNLMSFNPNDILEATSGYPAVRFDS